MVARSCPTCSPQLRRRWFKVSEVAEMTGLGEMTLYRAIKDGKFPAVKVSGRYCVPESALAAMEAAAVDGLVDAADWADPAAAPMPAAGAVSSTSQPWRRGGAAAGER